MPEQPPGLMEVALPYLGEPSPYEVHWLGDADSLLAMANDKADALRWRIM